jgi:hypothetical protein
MSRGLFVFSETHGFHAMLPISLLAWYLYPPESVCYCIMKSPYREIPLAPKRNLMARQNRQLTFINFQQALKKNLLKKW